MIYIIVPVVFVILACLKSVEVGVVSLFICEKPSVAQDLAGFLGANEKRNGFFQGNQTIVTWCVGHLVRLPEPHEISTDHKRWAFEALPILPQDWPLQKIKGAERQLRVIQELVGRDDVLDVVSATDAGREGELIFRLIHSYLKIKKPCKRLWLNSLTSDSIKKGLHSIRPLKDYDSLADSALARAKADWILGMNLSRAYSLKTQKTWSVGRVQTPTLNLIVERDKQIADFTKQSHLELKITAQFIEKTAAFNEISEESLSAKSKWLRAKPTVYPMEKESSLKLIQETLVGKELIIIDKHIKQAVVQPPVFYDLSKLQMDCNRLFKLSAKKTLSVAQILYEKHKVISYPRTDCSYLTPALAEELHALLGNKALIEFSSFNQELELNRVLNHKRYVAPEKIADHYAIIPVALDAALTGLEKQVFDLIMRRSMMPFLEDAISETYSLLGQCEKRLFSSHKQNWQKLGWKKLEQQKEDEKHNPLCHLHPQQEGKIESSEIVKKTTRPPQHFRDGSLLQAMISAGKAIEEKQLAQLIKNQGIGTAATRASIIESLVERGFAIRDAGAIKSTETGRSLIATVDNSVKSSKITAEWEEKLQSIESGEASSYDFFTELHRFIEDLVRRVGKNQQYIERPSLKNPDISVDDMLQQTFKLKTFRGRQKSICKLVVDGKNVLCVMPTGAGKSLCYQLPAMMREGVCLVVSPLIALMEDQVAKLKDLQMRAYFIHSGVSREDSQHICKLYLKGGIDFLFLTPERLSLPGFLSFLNKKRPALIAIDEAHCISHWGHDFRSDYRKIGQNLAGFTQTPIIALTATATKQVQDDILEQFKERSFRTSVSGFKRDNIAIEIYEVENNQRPSYIYKILNSEKNLPAIVYAGSRKQSEEIGEFLNRKSLQSLVYHAGMSSQDRSMVSQKFMAGDVDVLVATVAFGMGVDKANVRTVIHASIPGTLEAYYQEIGRAGRDRKPSKAFLLFSAKDLQLSEYLFRKSYPDTHELSMFYKKGVDSQLNAEHALFALDERDRGNFIHHYNSFDMINRDGFFRNDVDFSDAFKRYQKQRSFKYHQLSLMQQYVFSAHICRMRAIVEHFGEESAGYSCNTCDICLEAHSEKLLFKRRAIQPLEKVFALKVIDLIADSDKKSLTKVVSELSYSSSLSKSKMNQVIRALARHQIIIYKVQEFESKGRLVSYMSLSLSGKKYKSLKPVDIERVQIIDFSAPSQVKKKIKGKQTIANIGAEVSENPLYKSLRSWRKKESDRLSVPAFGILTNKTILEIVEHRPKSLADLSGIKGIGEQKLDRFGEDIMKIIANHRQ